MEYYLCKDILNAIGEYLPIKDVIKFNFYETFIKKELYSDYEWKLVIKYKRNNMLRWLFGNIQHQNDKLKKLDILLENYPRMRYYSKFEMSQGFLFCIAAEYGNLEAMKLLYSKFEYNYATTSAMYDAIVNNQFRVVKWLQKTMGRDPESHIFNTAAQYGNLKIIKFLTKNGYIGSTDAMDRAARDGNFKIVKWLHNNRTEGCTTNAMNWSARNGHFKIFRWLAKHRTEGYSKNIMNYIIEYGDLNKIKSFYEKTKLELTTESVRCATSTGNIEIFEWVYDKVKEVPENILYVAIYSKRVDMFKYLFKKGIRNGLIFTMENLPREYHNEILYWILLNC
jgi:hypothetical protein